MTQSKNNQLQIFIDNYQKLTNIAQKRLQQFQQKKKRMQAWQTRLPRWLPLKLSYLAYESKRLKQLKSLQPPSKVEVDRIAIGFCALMSQAEATSQQSVDTLSQKIAQIAALSAQNINTLCKKTSVHCLNAEITLQEINQLWHKIIQASNHKMLGFRQVNLKKSIQAQATDQISIVIKQKDMHAFIESSLTTQENPIWFLSDKQASVLFLQKQDNHICARLYNPNDARPSQYSEGLNTLCEPIWQQGLPFQQTDDARLFSLLSISFQEHPAFEKAVQNLKQLVTNPKKATHEDIGLLKAALIDYQLGKTSMAQISYIICQATWHHNEKNLIHCFDEFHQAAHTVTALPLASLLAQSCELFNEKKTLWAHCQFLIQWQDYRGLCELLNVYERKVDDITCEQSGRTLWHLAAKCNAALLMKLWLDLDLGSIDGMQTQDNDGITPLQLAIRTHRCESMQFILRHIPDSKACRFGREHCYSALGLAIKENSVKCFRSLIRTGYALNAPVDTRGSFPLHLIVTLRHEKFLHALIQDHRYQVETERTNKQGNTALKLAELIEAPTFFIEKIKMLSHLQSYRVSGEERHP